MVPWISGQPEAMLDLIYGEILLREDNGEFPTEDEYVLRFPELSDQVRRQFQVHRALMQDAESQYELETADYGKTVILNPGRNPELQPEPGFAGSELQTAPAGDRFPKIAGFQILGVAGRGGNGVAYRAMDTGLKRTVAIKLLDRDQSADPVRSQQLRREAEASAALVHPNIVRVFQVGEVSGAPFLVMEFIPGGSLAERLQAGPLPVSEAVELCRQIAEALHFAHSQNIVHRDLKPGNILIDADKRPRVCDFGLARKLNSDETLHQTGNIAGTPAYMPPEQARGEHVDIRADVYALGAVLYENLCGRPPFQAATPWEILHQVLTSDIIPLRQLNSGLPRDLETICAKCLEKNAAKRYATAKEVQEELQRFQRGEPIHARPIGRSARFIKWVRRNPLIAATVSTVGIALITVASIALLSERRVSDALGKTQQSLADAETQRDVALGAMNDLVHRVHDDLTKRQASVEARGEVLRSAIAGLKKIMEVAGNREDTRMTLAVAYTRYAYILSQQGQNEEAEKAHLLGIEVAETLTSDHGRGILAQGYSNIALHYVRAANPQATDDWAKKTLALATTLLENDPDNVDLQNIVIQAKTQMASAATSLKDPETAFRIRQDARETCAKLWAKHPDRTTIRDQLLALDQLLIGDCLTVGYYQLAERYLRETRELMMPLNPDTSEDVQVMGNYSSMLKAEGFVRFAKGQYEDAMASVSTGIALYEKLAAVEPNRPGTRLRLGTMHEQMAKCCLALNQLDKCEHHARKFIEEIRKGMELGGPTYGVQRYGIAQGQYLLGSVLFRKNQPADAVKELRQASLELEPILDQFNTKDVHAWISTAAELIAGGSGLDCKADPANIELVRRSLDAWRALMEGNLQVFTDQEAQLIADQQSVNDQPLRGMLTSQLAAMYAQRYNLLSQAEQPDETQLQAAEARCIEVLKELQSSPAAEPLLHMQLPEFSAIRNSERFLGEFPLK
jgi:serine/threonine protein kinase